MVGWTKAPPCSIVVAVAYDGERLRERLMRAVAEESTVDPAEHAERVAEVVERSRRKRAADLARDLLERARR